MFFLLFTRHYNYCFLFRFSICWASTGSVWFGSVPFATVQSWFCSKWNILALSQSNTFSNTFSFVWMRPNAMCYRFTLSWCTSMVGLVCVQARGFRWPRGSNEHVYLVFYNKQKTTTIILASSQFYWWPMHINALGENENSSYVLLWRVFGSQFSVLAGQADMWNDGIGSIWHRVMKVHGSHLMKFDMLIHYNILLLHFVSVKAHWEEHKDADVTIGSVLSTPVTQQLETGMIICGYKCECVCLNEWQALFDRTPPGTNIYTDEPGWWRWRVTIMRNDDRGNSFGGSKSTWPPPFVVPLPPLCISTSLK